MTPRRTTRARDRRRLGHRTRRRASARPRRRRRDGARRRPGGGASASPPSSRAAGRRRAGGRPPTSPTAAPCARRRRRPRRRSGRPRAGVQRRHRRASRRCSTMTEAQWDRMLAVHLRGTFLVTQAVLPDMIAARWGRIVTLSSVGGLRGGPNLTHYAAAKAGVIGFTKALALEVGPHGITANAIAPGLVDTPMLRGSGHPAGDARAIAAPDSGRPARHAGGHRRGVRLPGVGGRRLRHRAGREPERRRLALRRSGAAKRGPALLEERAHALGVVRALEARGDQARHGGADRALRAGAASPGWRASPPAA